jgi:cytidine deaminase
MVFVMACSNNELVELVAMAQKASGRAYCPYSRFYVGAAVLGGTGHVYIGCNVENASYGLTVCAERNAIFQAIAQGEHTIRAVVIYTPTLRPTTPCGACRQVMNEFGSEAEVICVCDSPEVTRHTVAELLPGSFGSNTLA